eukprot:jgi/Ulvmu1/1812/UM119_0030.1
MSNVRDAGLPGPEQIEVNSSEIEEIRECKAQLENRVQNLKQELTEWRSKLDTRMQSHRDELGVLRESLHAEVKTLQEKFQQLKSNLKTQLEETTVIANKEGAIAAQWSTRNQ